MSFYSTPNHSYSIQVKSFNLKTLRKSIQKIRYLYKHKFYLKEVTNKRNQISKGSFGLLKKYFRKKKVSRFLYIFVCLKNYILHRFTFCFYELILFVFSKSKDFLACKDIKYSFLLNFSLQKKKILQLQRSVQHYISLLCTKDRSHFRIGIVPSKRRRLTILRSPHVDKKSREQYELTIYRRAIFINLSGLKNAMKIRSFLESIGNIIEGVGYRVVERKNYNNYYSYLS
jgi:hypothetical protein